MRKPNRGRRFGARAAGAVLALGLGVAASGGSAGAQAAPAPRSTPKWGFDACEAPPLEVMRAWMGTSPYDTVAVYIGGKLRACTNAAFGNPAWITGALAMGWNVIPVVVDAQAPCTAYREVIDWANPALHGYLMSINTLASARSAGLQPGDPIYLDIESWDDPDPTCANAVREFVRHWAASIRGNGYVAGIYSTASTGIAAVINEPGIVDAVWVAAWNDAPGSMGDAGGPAWAGRRIHQYRGDHVETWAGQALDIDNNWIDGPVVQPRADTVETL